MPKPTAIPTTQRRRRRGAAITPICPPDLPEPHKSPAEIEADRQLIVRMQELTAQLHQRNLNTAVILAQQAAAGLGPLVDHFAELGRRYNHLLKAPARPNLRLVEGGALRSLPAEA